MSIKLFLLLFLTLQTTKGYSSDSCYGDDLNTKCVQVYVKSNTGEALKDLVVYLEPLSGQVLETRDKPLVIKQAGKSFAPYISVSQTNSEVSFVNQDDITHHIYSAGSENKFSFQIKAGQTNTSVKFIQPSDIAMGCNIHDWMSGYLLVVNTPYFSKTDEQGVAQIAIRDSGKYRIIVWHPQMQSTNNRMIREESISSNSQFTFKLANEMGVIPLQKSDDDFDFLSDYE